MAATTVMKFGGSCLSDEQGLALTLERIRQAGGPVVAVLSAFQGVTEELLALGEAALKDVADPGPLAARHRALLAAVPAEARPAAEAAVDELLGKLEHLLAGIGYLREVSDRTRDRLLSLGERLSVAVASAYLRGAGLDARGYTIGDLGLRTDGHHGDARILDDCAADVRLALYGMPVAVVPGFIGLDAAGRINTLGRGGSDYTATWIAAALSARCVLWKDVGGLSTADPKTVPGARLLPELDYLDALELAHYGGKVIHAKALAPAMRAGIAVEIRGFENPSQVTVISGKTGPMLAVASLRDAAVVDIHGFEEILPGLVSLLTDMAAVRVSPLLLTEASPRGETSVVLRAADLPSLEPTLARLGREAIVEVRRGLGVVSIIGGGMTGRVGFAAEVFQTLAAEELNIVAIAQTASERNVSVIVASEAVVRAARALHRRFIEGGA